MGGGVGASGMGCYHGREGFRNFSHQMSRFDFGSVGLLGLLWDKLGPNISLPYSDEDVKQIQSFLAPLPPIDAIFRNIRRVFWFSVIVVAVRNRAIRSFLLPFARSLV